MENEWIQDKRQRIRELYNDSILKNETSLAAYSVYMIKLLNGLEQMNYSQFYFYERMVLSNATKIFCDYYIEQLKKTKEKISVTDKKEIIDDIENAISELSEVFKYIIDGTVNSDRKLFSTLSVETNIYDLSPKLFAYYSSILNNLIKIFDMEDTYAFLLRPTLKRSIKTVNLFSQRKDLGKIALIYIPENKIEEIDKVPIYLLHEAFHVLSKKERARKIRALCLKVNIISMIKQVLFKGVDLDDDSIENLIEKWIVKQSVWSELDKQDDESRYFYGIEIEKRFNTMFNTCFQNILETFEKDVAEQFELKQLGQTDLNFGELCNQLEKIQQTICENLIKIMMGNWISLWIKRFMIIYREIYADLACILTLKIEPSIYETAFLESIPFYIDDDLLTDIERDWRMYIVGSMIAEIEKKQINIQKSTPWMKFVERKKMDLLKLNIKKSVEDKDNTPISGYIKPNFTENDYDGYMIYLRVCSKYLLNRLEEDNRLNRFREIIESATLLNILSTEKIEQLEKL